jgi:hypothetical protein
MALLVGPMVATCANDRNVLHVIDLLYFTQLFQSTSEEEL